MASGRRRISRYLHSQGWTPSASRRPTISRRVFGVESKSGNPQESQREKPGPKKSSSPDSKNGQTVWCPPNAVPDGTFSTVSFVTVGPLPGFFCQSSSALVFAAVFLFSCARPRIHEQCCRVHFFARLLPHPRSPLTLVLLPKVPPFWCSATCPSDPGHRARVRRISA